MTPEFAKAVDPIFEYVLELLDRVEQNQDVDPEQEQQQLNGVIARAERELAQSEAWQMAKFAFACWLDDMLSLRIPWDGRAWWIENPLEFNWFQTADRAVLFYVRAREAAQRRHFDALEVFYLCVILGFRGMYEEQSGVAASAGVEFHDLPPSLSDWLKETKALIKHRLKPPLEPSAETIPGAAPLEGRGLMTGALMLAAASAAIFCLTVWITIFHQPSS